MAKIDELTIGTDRITDGAITAIAITKAPSSNTLSNSGGSYVMSIPSANAAGNPVQVFFGMAINFPGDGTATGVTVSATLVLTRSSDGAVLYSNSYGSWGGKDHHNVNPNAQTIDMYPSTSDQYVLTFTYTVNNGGHPLGVPNPPTMSNQSLFVNICKR